MTTENDILKRASTLKKAAPAMNSHLKVFRTSQKTSSALSFSPSGFS